MRAGGVVKGGLRSLTRDSVTDRMARSTSSAPITGVLRPVALAGAALGTVRSLTKGAGHGGVTGSLSPAGAVLVAVSAASAATTAIRRRAESQ